MAALGALLLAASGTFLLRSASVRLLSGRALDDRVAVALRHASLAMMAALAIASIPAGDRFVLADGAALAGLGAGAGVVASRRVGEVWVVIAVAVSAYAAGRSVIG